MTENMLAPAARLWHESAPEFDPLQAVALETNDDLTVSKSMADSLKKVSRWLDHAITKLGACAAVADERDSEGLKPMAAEVMKAFIAAIGTMMSLRRGAGACLCKELQKAGRDLASTLEDLGASIGKPSMAAAAGRALDRADRLAHISTSNRIAIEKQLRALLEQLCDGHVDLKDALSQDGNEEDGLCDEDEDLDASLDPEDRCVAEAANVTVSLLKEVLEKAIASSGSPSPYFDLDLPAVNRLENVVSYGAAAVDATDSLIANILGGLDQAEVAHSIEKLHKAMAGVRGGGLDVQSVEESLNQVQAALEKVEG